MNTIKYSYKILSHTADFAVCFYGKNFKNFLNSIISFFNNEVYSCRKILKKSKKTLLENSENNLSYFIIDILNEIIFFMEKNYIINSINLDENKCAILNFTMCDNLDLHLEIKAATYHNIELINNPENINLKVVFDL